MLRGEHAPMRERAYREIKRRILDNELPAGAVVMEQELVDELAISRTPVREAMLQLAHEGLVKVRPRRGMFVLPVSPADMREIYEVLTALESEAAGQIAEHGLAPADAEALRDAVAAMDQALARDDLLAWAVADEIFHARLIAVCRNRRLADMVRQFWDQVHRARMLTLKLRPKPVDSNRDHLALIEALERGDAAAARAVHREHRVRNGRMLVELLDSYGLRHV
jgi:DNA-binding GntR family transcriptional regulator